MLKFFLLLNTLAQNNEALADFKPGAAANHFIKTNEDDDNSEAFLTAKSQLPNCSVTRTNEGFSVDCSNRRFTTIPRLPNYTIAANFSHNKVIALQPSTFISNDQLMELDLSYNMLTEISRGAFKGLVKLKSLSMRESNLVNITAEKLDIIIEDLLLLKKLTVTSRNSKNDKGNEIHTAFAAIKMLSKIETLIIDANIFCTIPKLQNHWNVKYLTLYNNAYQFCKHCTYKIFNSMSMLVSVIIFNNSLACIENDTFADLSNLEEFTVIAEDPEQNDFDILPRISKSLAGATKLNTFEVSGYVPRKPITMNSIFPSLSKTLTTVTLNRNYLQIPPHSCKDLNNYALPSSIRTLSLMSSCIFPGQISLIVALNKNLEIFNVSFDNSCIRSHSGNADVGISKKYNGTHNLKILQYTHYPFSYTLDEYSVLYMYNFSNLRHLDVSYSPKIDITNKFLSAFTNLEYLDLTECHVPNVIPNALKHLSKIKFLYLSGNAIQDDSLQYGKNKFHTTLYLERDSFSNMNMLQELDLSQNSIDSFEPSLQGLCNLHLLNISRNCIKTLSQQNMQDFDQIAQQNGNFTVDMSGQLFECQCETLHFLRWIYTTRTVLAFKETYMCDSPDNATITDALIHLKMHCLLYGQYLIASSVGVTLCMVLIAAALVHRYKWRLRYLFFMAKLNTNVKSKKLDFEQIYDYDAFISYASEDFELARNSAVENLEIRKQLKLCVHERDFKPGNSIAFNISKGIHGSRRTLLFFSKAFFASEWCRYEMNIARMETLYKQRDVILVIMLEDVPRKTMSIEILDLIDTSTYLKYPRSNRKEDIDHFWNKCHDFIVCN